MGFQRAELEVVVPRKMNTSEAQAWAKEVLGGGPPDKPIDVRTGEEIGWAHLQVGQKVRLRANPMGLIKEYPDGTKKYFAGAMTSCDGTSKKGTFSVEEMQRRSLIETKKREFAQQMIQKYNRNSMGGIRNSGQGISRAFWQAGKETRQFLNKNKEVKFSHIMLELKQWGIGCSGYAEMWFDNATHFYDWRPDLTDDDPIFLLSETRIMNLVRVRDKSKQNNLLISLRSGALHNFIEKKYDDPFKWIIGQSSKSCKNKAVYKELNEIGKRIMAGKESTEDGERLMKILKNIR